MLNIKVKRCNALNPATLLPVAGDAEEDTCDHDFVVCFAAAVQV